MTINDDRYIFELKLKRKGERTLTDAVGFFKPSEDGMTYNGEVCLTKREKITCEEKKYKKVLSPYYIGRYQETNDDIEEKKEGAEIIPKYYGEVCSIDNLERSYTCDYKEYEWETHSSNDYEIVKEIGHGFFSKVYEGRLIENDMRIAIKVI